MNRVSTYMQGKFKVPLRFDNVLTGQYFPGPLQHVPARLLINLILKICQQRNRSMQIGSVQKPSLLAPVVATAQCIHIARPGKEPPLNAIPTEDMRPLGPAFQTASGAP